MTLPEGWAEAVIGDLVEPIEADDPTRTPERRFRYVDIGSIDNTALRIAEPKEMVGREAPSRARRRIRTNDILFSTVRPYLKNIAMVPPELDGEFTSTGICVLRAAGGVEPGYIFRRVVSQDFIDSMTLASDGTMYPAIADRDVFGGRVFVPPVAEQRRIVATLDALTARLARARAELDRVPVLAASLRRTVLDDLWAFPSDLGLEELLAAPIRNGLSVKGSDYPPGIPALKLSALRGSCVDLADIRFLPITPERAAGYRLMDQDVLVSRGNGTLSLVGRAALVQSSTDDELPIFPDTAFRLRIDDRQASARWLAYVWNSRGMRRQIEAVARTTAGIWKISQRDLLSFRLPRTGRDQQDELVGRLDAAFARADRLEAEAARARALLDRLEAAILTKAFRGELVPQDPDDEPASVLLDRIRAQRAATPKPQRGRKRAMAATG